MWRRTAVRCIADVNTHTKGAYRTRSLHNERDRTKYSVVFGATQISDVTGSADGQIRRKQFLSFSDATRLGKAERFVARQHWGFLVPLVASLAEAKAYTQVHSAAPSPPLSPATIRRQFLFELSRNMPLLEDSVHTATVPLAARFLQAHTTLGVQLPIGVDAAGDAAGDSSDALSAEARHRRLLVRLVSHVEGLLAAADSAADDERTQRRKRSVIAQHLPVIAEFVAANRQTLPALQSGSCPLLAALIASNDVAANSSPALSQ
jgi:hypothetical protein